MRVGAGLLGELCVKVRDPLIEGLPAFARLKQFRRVATRFEKTARHYLAVVTIAAVVLWIR
jgi:transposase